MKTMTVVISCALLAACGGDDADDGGGDSPDAMVSTPDAADPGGIDAAVAPFELTSASFLSGTRIPDKHTCADADVSPPLTWTPGPAGTQSYAIVFTDRVRENARTV